MSLLLSGAGAETSRALFDGTRVRARVVGTRDRRRIGDEDGLRRLDEGQRGAPARRPRPRQRRGRRGRAARGVGDSRHPSLDERPAQAARGAAGKSWRWVGEMEEIAASIEADGLPGGFHEAAAELYERLAAEPGTDLDAAARRADTEPDTRCDTLPPGRE